MLCTVETVQTIPGLSNTANVPVAWLNVLIGAADRAIKNYCKRELELSAFQEFYSGNERPDLYLRQYPVLIGQTTVAAASDGVGLPAGTVNVVSTAGFHPGTAGNPGATAPTIGVQISGPFPNFTTITYTGTTVTSFTGCTGGTGTLSAASGSNRVFSPVVFFDPGAYGGQAASAFAASTQLVLGTQYMVAADSDVPYLSGQFSHRGVIKRIGGAGAGFIGFYPENFYSGKLASYRLPFWPRGENNLKVLYSAGYPPGQVPFDLQYACALLVARMVRDMPNGAALSSESLGGYSYSLLTEATDVPQIGSLARTLARYRESSW